MGIKKVLQKAADVTGTINDLFEEYINECKARNMAKPTLSSYTISKNRFLDFLGEDVPVREITDKTIFAYINYMLEDMVKPTTINHYLRDIRAFFNWCSNYEYIPYRLRIGLVKAQQEVIETYTEEEQIILTTKPLKTNSFVDWRGWAIVNFILATGARSSTIRNVKLGDLSFGRGEINFSHTKNKKAQIVPMSRELTTVLRTYIKMWRGQATDDAYLFCDIGENELSANALKLSIRRYNQSRGVTLTSVHAFRHTFAKQWIKNTGDVFRLQKLLGHSTLEMTRRYVNLFTF